MELLSEACSFLTKSIRLDPCRSMMMQLEGTLRRHSDLSKDFSLQMSMVRFAQQTGSQETKQSNLIKSRRMNSSPRPIQLLKMPSQLLPVSQSTHRKSLLTPANSQSPILTQVRVPNIQPRARRSPLITPESCLMALFLILQLLADSHSSSLSELARSSNAGTKA